MSVLLTACLVLALHDGDTATVKCPQRVNQITLRIAGIDAPEMAAFSWKTQPYAIEARDAARALCMGKTGDARLITYDSRTKRWVGSLSCAGTDLATALVTAGMAWVFMADAKSKLPAIQRQAQDQRTGLWSDPNAIAPTEWRKGSPSATCPCK